MNTLLNPYGHFLVSQSLFWSLSYFLAIALFVIRNITHLVINAIVGLITLFVVNFFHLMQYADRPDIGYDWITVIICALAGFPGSNPSDYPQRTGDNPLIQKVVIFGRGDQRYYTIVYAIISSYLSHGLFF